MSVADWLVLLTTLSIIVFYGMWKSRNTKNIESFLLADRKLPWYHIGLSVMATQASAITFLAGPGQGFSSGMGFVQLYFGLPLAMIVICVIFIPVYHRLHVYTAYEYLESRFGTPVRTFTAILFLLQRGISNGLTIYAPAIILSTILKFDIGLMIIVNGCIVILYTVYGGAKAVAYTQLLQMCVIFAGLFLAAGMVISLLPGDLGFSDALRLAGRMDKLNAIDTDFDLSQKYNIWSGIIGGFFLHLSYFGTDQSQVGRYLTGKSQYESKMGLLMNGILKIPMQFLILLIGVLVFVCYQFIPQHLYYDRAEVDSIHSSPYAASYDSLDQSFASVNKLKAAKATELNLVLHDKSRTTEVPKIQGELNALQKNADSIRNQAIEMIRKNSGKKDASDNNYVFLIFVTEQLPVGVVGILVAVIFLAGMGATSSGLSALVSTTTVDFYKRFINKDGDEKSYLRFSRISTLAWGVFCVVVAFYASGAGNLIEAVNKLGSLFYGVILGIFLVAVLMKRVNGKEVFIAAVISECLVAIAWYFEWMEYLWLNVLGCLTLVLIALMVSYFSQYRRAVQQKN